MTDTRHSTSRQIDTSPGASVTFPDDPAALLRAAATRTRSYDFTVWFWGDAIALDGLLEAAELLGDDESRRHCVGFLRTWASRPAAWTDHLTPGLALLRVAAYDQDQSLRDAAVRLGQRLRTEVPRSAGAPLYRPDDPRYRHTVWVDTLYHLPPFYAQLATVTDDASWYDHALDEWDAHVRLLVGPENNPFLAHSWDTGSHTLHGPGWGRGMGWALYGMVDTLELLPDHHPRRAAALEQFEAMAATVLGLQDVSGMWHTLLDDRESYLETSTAAFLGAVFEKAIRLKLLDNRYRPGADAAWHATRARTDADGALWGVSACTWAGISSHDDITMYRTLPTEVNVWGQGAAMRIAAERLRSSAAYTAEQSR
jgi:unsaturated rhamnogalacturonyl hydrolase